MRWSRASKDLWLYTLLLRFPENFMKSLYFLPLVIEFFRFSWLWYKFKLIRLLSMCLKGYKFESCSAWKGEIDLPWGGTELWNELCPRQFWSSICQEDLPLPASSLLHHTKNVYFWICPQNFSWKLRKITVSCNVFFSTGLCLPNLKNSLKRI